MPIPYERSDARAIGKYTPVQVFAPDTISASLTDHDVSNVLAVRTTADGTYYINAASGATAFVPAGTIIGIAASVTDLVFASAQVLEIMNI